MNLASDNKAVIHQHGTKIRPVFMSVGVSVPVSVTWMCVHTCVWCGLTLTSTVFLNASLTYLFRRGLSLRTWGMLTLARFWYSLLWRSLPLPLKCQDYKQLQLHLASYLSSGIQVLFLKFVQSVISHSVIFPSMKVLLMALLFCFYA